MSLLTVPVTCIANDAGGNPVAGALFSFQLVQKKDDGKLVPITEIYNGLVAPEIVEATADENGIAVVHLFPNALGQKGSQYRVLATNPDDDTVFLNGLATIPNAPAALHALLEVEPIPVLDAAQAAILTAQEAASATAAIFADALGSRDEAVGAAAAAAASQDAAAQSEANAQASAATASAQAVTATTKAAVTVTQAAVATSAAQDAADSQAAASAAQVAAEAAQAVATQKASLASDKSLEAATSASAAAAARTATELARDAGIAARDATQGFRDQAESSKNIASFSADTATTQGTLATTKAGEASTSAATASQKASDATASAGQAAISAEAARVSKVDAQDAQIAAAASQAAADTSRQQAEDARFTAVQNAQAAATSAGAAAGSQATVQTIAVQFGDMNTAITTAQASRDAAATSATAAATSKTGADTAKTAAQTAQTAAEAARDSVNTTGKVFSDTTTGIAGTTANQTFAVLDAGLQFWIIYKNNAGAALEVARNYTKAYIDSVVSPQMAVTQTLGRSVDPVDGSTVGANVFFWADPVAVDGTLDSLKVFFKATGTFKIARFTKAGTTMTRVAEASVTVSSIGLVTLTAIDFGTFPVKAGEYLALNAPSSFAFSSGTVADGLGWYQGIYSAAVTVGAAPTTSSRLQAQWNIKTLFVTAAKLSSMQAGIDSNTSNITSNTAAASSNTAAVNQLKKTVTAVVGTSGDPTDTGASLNNGGSVLILADPFTYGGALTFKAYARATGNITVSTWSKSGTTMTRTGTMTYAVTAVGLQTINTGLTVAPGEYVGFTGSGVTSYGSGAGATGSGYYSGAGTSFTASAPSTTSNLDVQATCVGSVQTVTAAAFDSALGGGNGAGTLSLTNVDKICVVSNSYNEAAGTLLGKSPVAAASALSEFNWGNFSKGGQDFSQLATLMVGTGLLYGATYKAHQPRYTLLCENQNSKNTTGMTDAAYYAAAQKCIDIARGIGSTPIVMSEWGMGLTNGVVATTDGEQRNVRGMRALADANGAYFIDGTSKSRTMNPSLYAAFWKSSHPGTRASYLVADALRQTAKVLPRPLRSMKIFRVRGTVTVTGVADLAFRSIQERHHLFREIYLGQMALSETEKVNYDSATALYASNQTQSDEYVLLAGGTTVSLGTYALIDCVLPVTGANGVTLSLPDTAVTVYVRKMTSTGISWVAVSLASGAFVVPDNAGFVDRDRISFLVYKAAGVSLNATPTVTWTSGTPRQSAQPSLPTIPRGAEMLAQPLTVVAGAIPAQWTNTGALAPAVLGDGATYLPGGNVGLTTGAVEVTSAAGLAQPVTYAQSDDPQEVVIRVWARRWVAPFASTGDFATAPITYETCDTGTLQVTLCGASGIANASATLKEQVGLHWTEVEFRETLPAGTTTTMIDIRSADVNLQIAKVSVRTA